MYIIHNREEYNEFLSKAEGVYIPDKRTLDLNPDFDKVALAIKFCQVDTSEWVCCELYNVDIQDGEVIFDYEIKSVETEEDRKPASCMMWASIPKEFLE